MFWNRGERMKIAGMSLLGLGILLFVIGICLYAGVIALSIPFMGWFAWIPMSIGGLLIIIGIVLLIIRR